MCANGMNLLIHPKAPNRQATLFKNKFTSPRSWPDVRHRLLLYLTVFGSSCYAAAHFPVFCVCLDKQIVSVWIRITQRWTGETEKSLWAITCHWWTLIIRIGSHRQHICSSFAARMWWAEAPYPLITLISALFIHLLPDCSHVQKFFVPENLQGKFVSFFFSIQSSVFTKLYWATTSHLVCSCIKLWHQPVLIVSRRGQDWAEFSFYFPFHSTSLSCSASSEKADNEKRCMMSC